MGGENKEKKRGKWGGGKYGREKWGGGKGGRGKRGKI